MVGPQRVGFSGIQLDLGPLTNYYGLHSCMAGSTWVNPNPNPNPQHPTQSTLNLGRTCDQVLVRPWTESWTPHGIRVGLGTQIFAGYPIFKCIYARGSATKHPSSFTKVL